MAEEIEPVLPDDELLASASAGPDAGLSDSDFDDLLRDAFAQPIDDLPYVAEDDLYDPLRDPRPLAGAEKDLPLAGPEEIADYQMEVEEWIAAGYEAEGKLPDEAMKLAEEKARGARLWKSHGYLPPKKDPDAKGIVAAGGRVLGTRRVIGVEDYETPKAAFDARMEEVRKVELEYRNMLQEEGSMEALKKVWAGSDPMTEDEAKESGIGIERQSFWGRDLQEGVDEDVSFFDDPYLPYGIKNIPELIERAAVKINMPAMFANLLLEEDEKEAYLKETRLALPTENFERIVETVELGREKGLTDEDIKKDFKEELGNTLMMQSYDDLPSGFQFKKPSVDIFKRQVALDPERFSKSNNGRLVDAASLVVSDASDKEIQEKLNEVSLGALPTSVWAGSIPSTTNLLDQAVQSADRVIRAKGKAGEAARVLEKGIESVMFSSERVGDEVMVVENTFGKTLRMLGVFTEGVAEARLPGDIPITPASRDFYYNYGLRDIDSTWLSRALANIETGNQGFMVHLTNEARADGEERGTSEFHTKLFIGGALDFLVPWEKLHLGPVAHTTKAAARGSSLAKKLNVKGYRGRAFLAGLSPSVYNRLYNVYERASLASESIRKRLPDDADSASLKRFLDQDEAARKAVDEGAEAVIDDFGREFAPLTYTQRRFAEDIFNRMQDGKTFDEASDLSRQGYKPDVFETAADVTEAVVRHVAETEEGVNLFPQGKKGDADYKPGVLPFTIDVETKRVLAAAGIRYEDVVDQLQRLAQDNANEYIKGVRGYKLTGADEDTIELRNSKEYLNIRKRLDKSVEDGDLTPEQKNVLLVMMETRAHNASGNTKLFKLVSEPEDYFKNTTIKKVKTKLADGSEGPEKIQIKSKLSKSTADEIDIDSIDQLIDIFKSEDTLSMTRLFDNDQGLLVDLMGKNWAKNFISNFSKEKRVGGAKKMPSNKLTKDGKKEAELKIRTVIEAQGRLNAETVMVRELLANIQSVYARLGEDAKQAILPSGDAGKMKRAVLDTLLKPDRFFRPELVKRNIRRPNRPGTLVVVDPKLSARLEEGIRAKAGRKRPFADIETQPEYVKQALGITEDVKEVDALDVFAKAVGYVVAETMKREEGSKALRGMDLVNLTGATFVTRDKVKSIRRTVNARMASILGIEDQSKLSGRTYLSAKRLKGMADSKSQTINLDEAQQARFKVFIQRLASEPFVASKIPQELVGPSAKIDIVSFENYNRVVELMTDVEASAFARRTVYTEAIPRSLAYSLLGSLRGGPGAKLQKVLPKLDSFVKGVEKRFKLDDPLSNVRPELKELLRRELSKLQGVREEVINLARDARRANPEATIEQIFDKMRLQLEGDMRLTPDQVELLLGNLSPFNDEAGKKGILSIMREFSEAEIARIEDEFVKSEKLKDPDADIDFADDDVERLTTRKKIVAGKDELAQGEYVQKIATVGDEKESIAPIVDGESRFQFLTKNSTRKLLQDLCSTGGFKGLDEEIDTALSILERYSSDTGMSTADVANLADVDRVMIADALFKIQNQLEYHAEYVRRRSEVILSAIAGEAFQLPSKIDDEALSQAYVYFHRGGKGWQKLYDLAQSKGAELGLDPAKVSDYSPAQAFLEMTVRLMAEDKLQGLYDTMVRHGMPGANVNYRIPKGKISPTGAQYSIETSHAFHDRVRGYMQSIFEFQDITEVLRKQKDTGSVVRKPGRPRGPYRHAAFEKTGEQFYTSGFVDLDAQLAAEEALVRFGVRTIRSGETLTDIKFPDGSIAYGPEAINKEIQDALVRAAAVGKAYGTDVARSLRPLDVGAPFIDVKKDPGVRRFIKTANAVDALMDLFPVTFQNIKRGVTTGLFIPNPAYYTANFLGGALQLFTAVDPIKGVTMLAKNPKMVGAVMGRMFADGDYKPFGNHIIVAKNGMIYNADQVADMALMYRLNSSFIQAETQRSMADDIKGYLRENETMVQKAGRYATAWNDYLADCATAVDNFYRVSIFVDQLNDGISPGQAAGLARRAAFDYSALTEWERQYARNVIMFYSYMRKNMDLFYDTLLTSPERITNQLRLTNGLHQANLENDPQAVLPEYIQERMMVGISNAVANKTSYDARMYVLPPTPIMDSLNLILNTYDTVRGDEEAARMLFTKFTPWLQMLPVGALGVDPFYGSQIDRYNNVPAWLMEWDLAVTGGQFREALRVTRKSYSNPRLMAEGRQYFHADNGRLWWFYRNMLQIPGTGRSMSIITQLDRSNMGVVEAITAALRGLRLEAEEVGLADEKDRKFEFVDGDTLSPRVGLTPMDEFLGVAGVRSQLVPNTTRVRQLILKDLDRTYKKRYPVSQDPYEQLEEQHLYEQRKLR